MKNHKNGSKFFIKIGPSDGVNCFMRELPLAAVGDSWTDDDARFHCNICGSRADFVVQLELTKGSKKHDVLHAQQTPFYLCKTHENVYKKMQKSIELKDYFTETIREHQ